MVSGFICSKNSNKHASSSNRQQPHQAQQANSPKPNKKSDKCKRSLSKTDSKKSISELLKTPAKDSSDRPSNSISSHNYSSSSNHAPKEGPSTSKSTLKPPTKVKSGSWKRSEKQISGYNGISVTGKKSKSLRKRSPTWLKFPNTPMKITDKATYVSPVDTTSVCRPGTLYSDVLFGAGSSCLVKIKTLTPRRSANTAQKKLTKALLKCAGNENELASGSETEAGHGKFPSLNGGATTPTSISPPTSATTGTSPDISPRKITGSSSAADENLPIAPSAATETITTTSTTSVNQLRGVSEPTTPISAVPKCEDDADVVILSVANGVCGGATENGLNDVSYGNYLDQHFKQMNCNTPELLEQTQSITNIDVVGNGICDGSHMDSGVMPRSDVVSSGFPNIATKPFTIDIPQWNFLEADISTDAYPKFLCQFEDEHYLKAEKMAMLGLKLALGNGNSNPQQGKFKF
ncbi:flocculation protein FLO11-like [Rhagoletis pomonella]|uniref:flocculation protein FLO11-like n=1 Tax=Rhagoletis pomonella TaxID=28610 RepID=UPI00177CB84E|nr:flocculation protein FLO11-like [Rhagoletis pomonella]